MKKIILCISVSLLPFFLNAQPKRLLSSGTNDVILQGFYWNTNMGDLTDTVSGGIWWDSLNTASTQIRNAGFKTIWLPPFSKAFGGSYDMGYGIYDYYDLGEFNQKGVTRTRFGNKAQLSAGIASLKGAGLTIMADVVLNHRGGADAQQAHECSSFADIWTIFNPLSGKFAGDASNFHPNNLHCDTNADFHNPLFFQDLCYFNGINSVLDDPYGGGNSWFFGPHNLGKVGDELILWGRWLKNTVGIDELRLDAVKHIEPGFLAPFLVELNNGAQPFAVGEFYDSNVTALKNYQNDVNGFVSSYGTGSKDASLALFDFSLQGTLKNIVNDGTGSQNLWDLNASGLYFNGVSEEGIVTFIENHDKDRGGYRQADCGTWNSTSSIYNTTVGATCLEYFFESDHNPTFSDKHMAYAYLMASPGRPTVFWKDYFWYHLDSDIDWLINLRKSMATGAMRKVADLNGFWPTSTPYDGDNHGGNIIAMTRPNMILTLNDKPSKTGGLWIDTPFTNTELRDYSDYFLFESTQSFGDTRTFVKAGNRNYAWYAPTGRYPISDNTPPSSFTLGAAEGGKLHYIVLRASDVANLQINGVPLAVGDEIAVLGTSGLEVAGIGRIGQTFRWDGIHDMVIEVLGNFSENTHAGRLNNNDLLRIAVKDQSTGQILEASSITYLASGTGFSMNALRANSRTNSSPAKMVSSTAFNATTTSDNGLYATGAISVITAFNATSILPLSMSDLTILEDEEVTQLSWHTAVENDILGFEIQHQTDGSSSWTALGFVDAKGYSTEGASYHFELSNFDVGLHTFRLKIIEANGASSYSKSVSFHKKVSQRFILEAYPNPFNPSSTVKIAIATPQKITLELYNVIGQKIKTLFEGNMIENETFTFTIDGKDLPSGTYILRLNGESFLYSHSLTLLK